MGCSIIAYLRGQWSTECQTFFHQLPAPLFIGRKSLQAFLREVANPGSEQLHRLQQIVRHHRQHDVEFQVSSLPTNSYSPVIGHDLHCHLEKRFNDDRIDLAGHD